MNIAIRKLALLEKTIKEQENSCDFEGLTTVPIDNELKQRISELMIKVRTV